MFGFVLLVQKRYRSGSTTAIPRITQYVCFRLSHLTFLFNKRVIRHTNLLWVGEDPLTYTKPLHNTGQRILCASFCYCIAIAKDGRDQWMGCARNAACMTEVRTQHGDTT